MKKAAVLLLLLFLCMAVFSENFALVIGNASYTYAALKNPVNDATDVYKKLKDLDFTATLATNLGQSSFEKTIKDFSSKISTSDTVLFYYTGHATELWGKNYLIPVDLGDVRGESDIEDGGICVDDLVSNFQKADRFFIVLDSCRNNPFSTSKLTTPLMTRGLSVVSAPKNTEALIVYATQPGNYAYDGTGRNSFFSQAFIENIETPNTDIELMLRKVRESVKLTTGGRQIPWTSSSLIRPFYFNKKDITEKELKTVIVSEIENKASSNVSDTVIGNDPFSICMKINSLELQKKTLNDEYNIEVKKNQDNIDSWYRTEYNRRIKAAVKNPWDSDADFQNSLQEAIANLDMELKTKQSVLASVLSDKVADENVYKIQLELDKYYSILNASLFVQKTNNCSIRDFNADEQYFPVLVKLGTDQIDFQTQIKYFLSNRDEVLSSTERGKRYNLFNNRILNANIKYRIFPDYESAGQYANFVTGIDLFDSNTNEKVLSQEVNEKANVFVPGRNIAGYTVSTNVVVYTNPAGATILVNGIKKGTSPLILTDLEEGDQVIEAVWSDGSSKKEVLDVFTGLDTSVTIRK